VSNQYNEEELKMILCNNLTGDALRHFNANEGRLLMAPFGVIVEEFQEKFGRTVERGLQELVHTKQGPHERVIAFAARIKLLATALLPPMPTEVIVQRVEGGSTVVAPTPFLDEWKSRYDAEMKMSSKILITYFVRGLRQDIRMKMNRYVWDTLDECITSAEQAENFLVAAGMLNLQMHKLSLEEGQSSNQEQQASVNKLQFGNQGNQGSQGFSGGFSGKWQSGGDKKPRNKTKDKCFGCNETGHWKSECPNPQKNKKGKGKGKPKYDRSRSSSPRTKSFENKTKGAFEDYYKARRDQSKERERNQQQKNVFQTSASQDGSSSGWQTKNFL
jgi:hypothetical protein